MRQPIRRSLATKSRTDFARRNFLLAAGAGGVGSVVALAGLSTAPEAVCDPAEKQKQGEGKGYRLSEHVRSYYRTTRV